jgi:hypothetical protein
VEKMYEEARKKRILVGKKWRMENYKLLFQISSIEMRINIVPNAMLN